MSSKNNLDKVQNAVYELAKGFKSIELTEEFIVDEEGVLKLQKKRIVTKNLPPDLEAYKLLYGDTIYDEYTDEQLEKEKERLLKQLINLEKKEK